MPRQDWATPKWLFTELDGEFHFDLDVCADAKTTKCAKWIHRAEDALSQNWQRSMSACWMHPPYGRAIGDWVRKALAESRMGVTVVCLLPARTDTAWFHDYCTKGEIHFLRGRLRFDDGKKDAPFPSMVVIFQPRTSESPPMRLGGLPVFGTG